MDTIHAQRYTSGIFSAAVLGHALADAHALTSSAPIHIVRLLSPANPWPGWLQWLIVGLEFLIGGQSLELVAGYLTTRCLRYQVLARIGGALTVGTSAVLGWMAGSGQLTVIGFFAGYSICYCAAAYCASWDSVATPIVVRPSYVGEFVELTGTVSLWAPGNLDEGLATHVASRVQAAGDKTLNAIVSSADAQKMAGFISQLQQGLQQPLNTQSVQDMLGQIKEVASRLMQLGPCAKDELEATVPTVLRDDLGTKWDAIVMAEAKLGQRATEVVTSVVATITSRPAVLDDLQVRMIQGIVQAVCAGTIDTESIEELQSLIAGINSVSTLPATAQAPITAEPLLEAKEKDDDTRFSS